MSNAAKPKFRNYKAPMTQYEFDMVDDEKVEPFELNFYDPDDNEGPTHRVMKGWGREDWLLNNAESNLCVKILTLEYKKNCSFHFHKEKAEIFFVITGQIYFEWKDTETGETQQQTLLHGDSVYIPPGCPHRFTGSAEKGSVFLEASTFHKDSDSYRIFPGDSQNA